MEQVLRPGIKEVTFFDESLSSYGRVCSITYGYTEKPIPSVKVGKMINRRITWLDMIWVRAERPLDPLDLGDNLTFDLEVLGAYIPIPIILQTYGLDNTFVGLLFDMGLIDGIAHDPIPDGKKITKEELINYNKTVALVDTINAGIHKEETQDESK